MKNYTRGKKIETSCVCFFIVVLSELRCLICLQLILESIEHLRCAQRCSEGVSILGEAVLKFFMILGSPAVSIGPMKKSKVFGRQNTFRSQNISTILEGGIADLN